MSSVTGSTGTVLALLFTLICLVILLIFMYKKLKKESNGEYTIRRIVYKEGGVRDQVRGAAMALETRLGIQLWPHSNTEHEEEEMGDMQDVEAKGSCRSDTEGDQEPGEEEEEDNSVSYGRENTDDGSSLVESEENAKLMDEPKVHEEKVDETEDTQDKVKGTELLIDLNNFSGSAIWSGEQGGEDMCVTGTAL